MIKKENVELGVLDANRIRKSDSGLGVVIFQSRTLSKILFKIIRINLINYKK